MNAVMANVHGLVGGDPVKALQLSDRLQQHARGQVAHDSASAHDQKHIGMCVNVSDSLKHFQDQSTK